MKVVIGGDAKELQRDTKSLYRCMHVVANSDRHYGIATPSSTRYPTLAMLTCSSCIDHKRLLVWGYEKAFQTPFVGRSVDALYELLFLYEKSFRAGNADRNLKTYYARYFPIIQSSGTGKTKTVLEVELLEPYTYGDRG